MLDQLKPGDVLVADCFYCTYWLIAACRAKEVNIVMKNHHKRDDDPIGANRINKRERTITWLRPQRPSWMSQEEYQDMPDQLEVRLVDIVINQSGFRSKKFTVATTIMDRAVYSRQWIASVLSKPVAGGVGHPSNKMFTRHGRHPCQNSSDGQNRNLVVLVGLQSNSHEDATELRG